MKKNIVKALLLACFVLPCMMILTACFEHTHSFSSEWTINATHHWHSCMSCDEKADFAEHNWSEGVVAAPATPTANGVRLYVCEDCKTTKTEAIEYVAETTVTESQWQTALNLSALVEFELNMGVQTVTKDGDILRVNQTSEDKYYSKEGDNYYLYSNATGSWVKTAIEEQEYSYYVTEYYNLSTMYNYEDYTYNTSTKQYEGNDMSFYFEDRKVISIVTESFEMNIGYDNINLTLPEIL